MIARIQPEGVGVDRARAETDRRDPSRSELDREIFHDRLHRCLSGTQESMSGQDAKAVPTGYREDSSASRHVGHAGAHKIQEALDRDSHCLVHVVRMDLRQRLESARCCVGDEHIDRLETIDVLHEPDDSLGVRDIGLDGDGLTAGLLDSRDGALRRPRSSELTTTLERSFPNLTASRWPMPREAPVMTTVLPLSSISCLSPRELRRPVRSSSSGQRRQFPSANDWAVARPIPVTGPRPGRAGA